MLAKTHSAAVQGIDGVTIDVEVDISNGLPSFTIVGLPDGPVRESRDRVKAAIKNSGYPFPTRKITVNLAPADLKKEGSFFDLPIALGLLAASGLLEQDPLKDILTVGELSLNGAIRPVTGILPLAMAAREQGFSRMIVPSQNGLEAALVTGLEVVALEHLHQVVEMLSGTAVFEAIPPGTIRVDHDNYPVCFEDVKGHQSVKRALTVAVSGMHNVLLSGPPGSGKTMVARSLVSVMPELSQAELFETSRIHSVAGETSVSMPLIRRRPFRAPHHTISDAALVGGGSIPRPGEASLAHHGILFLDELPEFRRNVLEALRQPLEDGFVTISRARKRFCFPARFMLVAAMNPCPCGHYGSEHHACHCNELQIQRYRSKISGPLLDRIDLHLEVPVQPLSILQKPSEPAQTSAEIRATVNLARSLQEKRFEHSSSVHLNGQMRSREVDQLCQIGQQSKQLLARSVEQLGLSARGYHRILRVARTIADIEGSDGIETTHIAEAIQYRRGLTQHSRPVSSR